MLGDYVNQEIKEILRSMTVEQGNAKDSGNIYYYVSMKFINGYEKRLFLNNDEVFAWVNAIEALNLGD